jgi:hypothetical protein
MMEIDHVPLMFQSYDDALTRKDWRRASERALGSFSPPDEL